MCLGKSRKGSAMKGSKITQAADNSSDYSHIFTELENQLIIHRALLMQRLVQDPFYKLMNISTTARLWMLRHLVHLAEMAEENYRLNLLQFFEFIGRSKMLKLMRYKNAPTEMMVLLEQLFPPPIANVTHRKPKSKKRRV